MWRGINHATLEDLELGCCNIGNDEDIFRKLLEGCTVLTHKNLSSNRLGPRCAHVIADFISNNRSAEFIMLQYNNISGTAELELLASALR